MIRPRAANAYGVAIPSEFAIQIAFAGDLNRSCKRGANAHESFRKLGLTVPAYAGNAVDLTGVDNKARPIERDMAVFAGAPQVGHVEPRLPSIGVRQA
jgi:hypothetical protein